MAYWDVFADVSYPPFVADDPGGLLPTEFDNLAYATITANTSWQLIALSTVLAVPNRLDVPAVVGFTTAAGMSIGLPAGWIAIDGDASFGAWSLDCALTRVISSPGNISTYTELVDTGFLGAWKGAVGPSGSVFIAGEESREIMCVEYSDAKCCSCLYENTTAKPQHSKTTPAPSQVPCMVLLRRWGLHLVFTLGKRGYDCV